MGIFGILIGGVIGYLIGSKVIAKNWLIKLCYAVLIPIVFDIIVIAFFAMLTGSNYLAGAYSTPFIIGSLAYLVLVLIKMKIIKK